MDMLEEDDTSNKADSSTKRKSNLNNAVAIAVALIATFMGICKVKDDNIVQAMQQAQADRIDHWSWYQARNMREEIAKATVIQLQLQAASQSPQVQTGYSKQISTYQAFADKEEQKKQTLQQAVETDQKNYDELNFHDDQFDLADATLSLAVSLFAITSLSQKRWLFFIAIIPTTLGLIMGLSGLLGWRLHPTALTKLLSLNLPQQAIEQRIVSIKLIPEL
ncbi:DUF4337 domain-containing protein [Nostoc sp. 106C]|uniref:DUF4337 domain-containing protein n=1 Tax=Nostoc sp. 106C TaxID=1932667 RepID=UPI001AA1C723|nr:DUF4337 domain-containing protein [Nostoc sp. 106C]